MFIVMVILVIIH